MAREIKVYNTMTRQKEIFSPLEPGKVGIYVCGVTPYNDPHIGNARPFVTWDVIRRFFAKCGYEVRYIQNFTDVDDKIIRAANERGVTWKEISDQYIDAYFRVMDELNVRRADVYPRVSETMAEIIEMVQGLVDKGFAYEAGGNIYFDTSKLDKYYVFHGFAEEDLEVGVREGVEADENKRNRADFVLWFTKSKFEDQELKWESPWGTGYPGWHIECSCIEMSKSSGEFLTVSLLESKGYDPLAYRFFCLQSHYRKNLVFSYENLDNASASYRKLVLRVAALLREAGASADKEPDAEALAALKKRFTDALDNDLNTSLAVTALYDALKSPASPATRLAAVRDFDTVLKLGLEEKAAAQIADEAEKEKAAAASGAGQSFSDDPAVRSIEERIAARAAAKKAKNWAEADRIRAELLAEGIVLTDTPAGTQWSRKEG